MQSVYKNVVVKLYVPNGGRVVKTHLFIPICVGVHPAGLEPANCPIMSWVLLPLSHGCFGCFYTMYLAQNKGICQIIVYHLDLYIKKEPISQFLRVDSSLKLAYPQLLVCKCTCPNSNI